MWLCVLLLHPAHFRAQPLIMKNNCHSMENMLKGHFITRIFASFQFRYKFFTSFRIVFKSVLQKHNNGRLYSTWYCGIDVHAKQTVNVYTTSTSTRTDEYVYSINKIWHKIYFSVSCCFHYYFFCFCSISIRSFVVFFFLLKRYFMWFIVCHVNLHVCFISIHYWIFRTMQKNEYKWTQNN